MTSRRDQVPQCGHGAARSGREVLSIQTRRQDGRDGRRLTSLVVRVAGGESRCAAVRVGLLPRMTGRERDDADYLGDRELNPQEVCARSLVTIKAAADCVEEQVGPETRGNCGVGG